MGSSGCSATVRTSSTTSRSTTRTTPCRRCRRASRRGSSAASISSRRARRAAGGASRSWAPARSCGRSSGRRSSCRRSTTCPPTCIASRATSSCATMRSPPWGSIPTSRSLARPSSGGGFPSGSNERAIPDAVRAPVGADCLAHEFLIRLVVALEPPDTAIAFEDEQVRGDPVEEPAVVTDDHDAPGEVEQRLLERAERVHVEIVRRLVEEQHVAARAEELAEMHAVALATGKVPDLLLLVRPTEVERRRVGARVATAVADLDVLLSAGDLFPDRLRRIERVAGLRHV